MGAVLNLLPKLQPLVSCTLEILVGSFKIGIATEAGMLHRCSVTDGDALNAGAAFPAAVPPTAASPESSDGPGRWRSMNSSFTASKSPDTQKQSLIRVLSAP